MTNREEINLLEVTTISEKKLKSKLLPNAEILQKVISGVSWYTNEPLTNASFYGCKFRSCDFSYGILQSVTFTMCLFEDCRFKQADMEFVKFDQCVFSCCDMSFSTLSKVVFEHCEMDELALCNARASDLVMSGCSVTSSTWRHTRLYRPDIENTIMYDVDISGSQLLDGRWVSNQVHECYMGDTAFRGMQVDYSTYQLACTTLHIQIDDDLAVQFLYHLMSMALQSPYTSDELKAALRTPELVKYGSQFTRSGIWNFLQKEEYADDKGISVGDGGTGGDATGDPSRPVW